MNFIKKLLSVMLLASIFSVTANCATEPHQDEPSTVSYVDLERYMGHWYEIARFPQWFQKDCGASTANYKLKNNGTVEVLNSCKRLDDPSVIKDGKGTAFVKDKDTNSKLKVSFVPILRRFGLFAGDYWILELGADYDYVLVGGPDRKSLWILSRTPTLPQSTYDYLLEVAADKGFDVSKIVVSPTWN